MNMWIRAKGFVFAVSGCIALLSCNPGIKRSIHDNVSGPFAILNVPNSSNLIVINSTTSGEYEDGSLALYSAEASGKLGFKSALSTERLGLSGTVSGDGKLIVVSYAGDNSSLRFYSFENNTLSEKTNLRILTNNNEVFEQLQFFTPSSAAPSQYYLFGYVSTGKILVYRIDANETTQILTLPDNMPGVSPENDGYRLALGAPVYIEKSDLLVGFPLDTADTASLKPTEATAYQVATGAWDATTGKTGDLRAQSMLVVDFEKYLAEKSVRNAAAYIPFLHRDDYTLATKAVADDTKNPVRYRYSFQSSVYVNQGGCVSRNAGTFAEDSVLVSENPTEGAPGKSGNILQLDNWDALKAKISGLTQVMSDASFNYRQKLIYEMPTLKIYSNAKDLSAAAVKISHIQILEQNSTCIPIWGRTNSATDAFSPGMEKMRLVTQVNNAASESSDEILPRGIVNFTVSGSQIFASSYSFDLLKTLKFENNVFSVVP